MHQQDYPRDGALCVHLHKLKHPFPRCCRARVLQRFRLALLDSLYIAPILRKTHQRLLRPLRNGIGHWLLPLQSNLSGSLCKTKLITLCDLNPNTLLHSKNCIANVGHKGSVETLQYDISQPFAHEMHGEYDSVALYYLFHCLSGSFPQKAADVFANVAPALAPRPGWRGVRVYYSGQRWGRNWLESYLTQL